MESRPPFIRYVDFKYTHAHPGALLHGARRGRNKKEISCALLLTSPGVVATVGNIFPYIHNLTVHNPGGGISETHSFFGFIVHLNVVVGIGN